MAKPDRKIDEISACIIVLRSCPRDFPAMNGRISVVSRIPVVPFKYRFISWNAINKALTQMSQALCKMELYSLGLILLDRGYQPLSYHAYPYQCFIIFQLKCLPLNTRQGMYKQNLLVVEMYEGHVSIFQS